MNQLIVKAEMVLTIGLTLLILATVVYSIGLV